MTEAASTAIEQSEARHTIEQAFENRAQISPTNADPNIRSAVQQVLSHLDAGTLRVAEKTAGAWVVNQWVKKAVLLSFRLEDNSVMPAGYTNFYDKVPTRFAQYDAQQFKESGVRIVPPAAVRREHAFSNYLQ